MVLGDPWKHYETWVVDCLEPSLIPRKLHYPITQETADDWLDVSVDGVDKDRQRQEPRR